MLDEAFLYSEAIDLTTYGARSDQKTVLTPNRNARDVRNAGEGSLEPVSGTNTSPIALIFNCGPLRKDAVTPNFASHRNR
jgi:hypothetical protein